MSGKTGAKTHDVIVIGAGPAGLSLALSLAALDLRVAVIERQPREALAAPADDGREIALTHGSMRILRALGAAQGWSVSEISPIRAARVYNGRSARFLDFHSQAGDSGPLGYLVANHCIRRELYRCAASRAGIELLFNRRVLSCRAEPRQVVVETDADGALRAALLVAADSRHSETRRAMGIGALAHDFGKTMLVTRVAHSRPHQGVAMEWFDFGRTIATLPLCGRQSSLILTLPGFEAERLAAAEPAALEARLNQWLDGRLGELHLTCGVHRYPLVAVYARRFVGPRFALVGDAAVGMHPVTAHGFNFGLCSQKLLAETLAEERRAGGELGSDAALARYERAHRRRTWPLYQATNAIATLYALDAPPARALRSLMLGLGERVAPLKRAIVRELRS